MGKPPHGASWIPAFLVAMLVVPLADAGESTNDEQIALNHLVDDAPRRGVNTRFDATVNKPTACQMHLAIGHYEHGNPDPLPSSRVLQVELTLLEATVGITASRSDQLWSQTLHLKCKSSSSCISTCRNRFLGCYVDPEFQTFVPDTSEVSIWAWSLAQAQELAAGLESHIAACANKGGTAATSPQPTTVPKVGNEAERTLLDLPSQLAEVAQNLGTTPDERFDALLARARRDSPKHLEPIALYQSVNRKLRPLLDSKPNPDESDRLDRLCIDLLRGGNDDEADIVWGFQIARHAKTWPADRLIGQINAYASRFADNNEAELAESWLKVALDKSIATWGENSTQAADAHAMLGLTLGLELGRPYRGEESLARAASIYRNKPGPKPQWWNGFLVSYAMIQMAVAGPDRAAQTLKQVVADGSSASPMERCTAYALLSKLAAESGDRDRALVLARSGWHEAKDANTDLKHGMLFVLADVHAQRGEISEALRLVRTLPRTDVQAARRESDYLLMLGDTKAARSTLRRAHPGDLKPLRGAAAASSWKSPSDMLTWLGDHRRLAKIQEAEGASQSALQSYLAMQEVFEVWMRMTSNRDAGRAALWDGVSEGNREAVSFGVRSAGSSPSLRRFALETAIRAKARTLDTQRAEYLRGHSRTGPRKRLAAALARVSAAAVGDDAQAMRTALRQFHLTEEDFRGSPTNLVEPLPPSLVDAVQSKLRPGEALLEYVEYNPQPPGSVEHLKTGRAYAALVLLPNGEPEVVPLGAKDKIDSLAARFVAALSQAEPDYVPIARSLYEALLAPLLSSLGESRSVFISPTGPLNLIPFSAFVNRENEFSLSRWRFAYLTSARDMLKPPGNVGNSSPPVLVADPAFGTQPPASSSSRDGRNEGWRLLPETRSEAQNIAAKLPGAHVLFGAAASEAALKRLHSPSLLHISTHGFFLPVSNSAVRGMDAGEVTLPSRLAASGLVLAGANTGGADGEDGLLTSGEFSLLDLRNTQHVTIAACESGVGGLSSAAGVEGFRAAISVAGARSQLVSLWKVQDAATRALVNGFYTRLLSGESRAAALRKTQLEMAKSPETNLPFLWASFILIGDTAALDGRPPEPIQVHVRKPMPHTKPNGTIPPRRGACACDVVSAKRSDSGSPFVTAFLLCGLQWVRRRRHANRSGNGRPNVTT